MDIKILVELVRNGGCVGYNIPCGECPVDNRVIIYLGCSIGSGDRARALLAKYSQEEIFEALL